MTDTKALYRRLPHAGSMCLVDEVIDWDRECIRCGASGHRSADNPLRIAGRLPAICVLEYAAQAFALHGLLIADECGGRPPDAAQVFVAVVTTLDLHTGFLDDRDGMLRIDGHVVFRQAGAAVYRFEVRDAAGPIADGQIGLVS